MTLETAAAMTRGGLPQVAELYHVTCVCNNHAPGRLMCSYFIHFADTKAERQAARARQIRYYKECLIAAFPGDPKRYRRATAISSRWSNGCAMFARRI